MLKNKKAVLIIPFKNYHDEEFDGVKRKLEQSGIQVDVVSSHCGQARGKFNGTFEVSKDINEIDIANYDVAVFIGGYGATEYFENPRALEICNEAVKQSKVLAAICIAPVILARAGVLKNKKATVWASSSDILGITELEKAGVEYTSNPVEVDGKIITGREPESTSLFSEKIKEILDKK